jgi:2-hydroxy-6-oxonona-2,4-dienedioate hydrolase
MTLIQNALQGAKRHVQSYPWGDAVWHVWGSQNTATASPLVLLHGGSGSWTHWVRNVQYLSQHRTVWALDLPGFGDSDVPDDVRDADTLTPYVGQILQHTFDGAAVDVMGFSFGGMTAGLLAAEQPACIKQMILVGVPGLGLFGEVLPMRGMSPDMTDAQQRTVHRHNLKAMMLAHDSSIDEALIDLQQANVARDRMRRRRIAKSDVLAKAQSGWTCPVHGIWGAQDALYKGTLEQVPHILHALESYTVIPDAGHWVMYERPDAFHAAVTPLL